MRRPLEILLVESDVELADLVSHFLNESLGARVTYAPTAAEALREELTGRHDLLLADTLLPDGDGLDLVRQIRRNNPCPAILMADAPTADEAIAALRLGVDDLLSKPFDLDYLCASVRSCTERHRVRRRERIRHKRLRRLVARIVCERRDLARRIDLICRDFVQAHRRLAEKVAESGMLTDGGKSP